MGRRNDALAEDAEKPEDNIQVIEIAAQEH
jgi:hypothetical protein